jgi:hypothetical protein
MPAPVFSLSSLTRAAVICAIRSRPYFFFAAERHTSQALARLHMRQVPD